MTKVGYRKNDLGCMHDLQFASTFGQIFIFFKYEHDAGPLKSPQNVKSAVFAIWA